MLGADTNNNEVNLTILRTGMSKAGRLSSTPVTSTPFVPDCEQHELRKTMSESDTCNPGFKKAMRLDLEAVNDGHPCEKCQSPSRSASPSSPSQTRTPSPKPTPKVKPYTVVDLSTMSTLTSEEVDKCLKDITDAEENVQSNVLDDMESGSEPPETLILPPKSFRHRSFTSPLMGGKSGLLSRNDKQDTKSDNCESQVMYPKENERGLENMADPQKKFRGPHRPRAQTVPAQSFGVKANSDIISDALSRQKAKAKSSIPLTHDPVKDQRSKSPSEEADDPPNDYSSPLLHPQVSHHALQNGDLFSDCGIVPDYSERGDELKGCDGVEHDSFNDDVFEWPSPPSDQLIEDSEASNSFEEETIKNTKMLDSHQSEAVKTTKIHEYQEVDYSRMKSDLQTGDTDATEGINRYEEPVVIDTDSIPKATSDNDTEDSNATGLFKQISRDPDSSLPPVPNSPNANSEGNFMLNWVISQSTNMPGPFIPAARSLCSDDDLDVPVAHFYDDIDEVRRLAKEREAIKKMEESHLKRMEQKGTDEAKADSVKTENNEGDCSQMKNDEVETPIARDIDSRGDSGSCSSRSPLGMRKSKDFCSNVSKAEKKKTLKKSKSEYKKRKKVPKEKKERIDKTTNQMKDETNLTCPIEAELKLEQTNSDQVADDSQVLQNQNCASETSTHTNNSSSEMNKSKQGDYVINHDPETQLQDEIPTEDAEKKQRSKFAKFLKKLSTSKKPKETEKQKMDRRKAQTPQPVRRNTTSVTGPSSNDISEILATPASSRRKFSLSLSRKQRAKTAELQGEYQIKKRSLTVNSTNSFSFMFGKKKTSTAMPLRKTSSGDNHSITSVETLPLDMSLCVESAKTTPSSTPKLIVSKKYRAPDPPTSNSSQNSYYCQHSSERSGEDSDSESSYQNFPFSGGSEEKPLTPPKPRRRSESGVSSNSEGFQDYKIGVVAEMGIDHSVYDQEIDDEETYVNYPFSKAEVERPSKPRRKSESDAPYRTTLSYHSSDAIASSSKTKMNKPPPKPRRKHQSSENNSVPGPYSSQRSFRKNALEVCNNEEGFSKASPDHNGDSIRRGHGIPEYQTDTRNRSNSENFDNMNSLPLKVKPEILPKPSSQMHFRGRANTDHSGSSRQADKNSLQTLLKPLLPQKNEDLLYNKMTQAEKDKRNTDTKVFDKPTRIHSYSDGTINGSDDSLRTQRAESDPELNKTLLSSQESGYSSGKDTQRYLSAENDYEQGNGSVSDSPDVVARPRSLQPKATALRYSIDSYDKLLEIHRETVEQIASAASYACDCNELSDTQWEDYERCGKAINFGIGDYITVPVRLRNNGDNAVYSAWLRQSLDLSPEDNIKKSNVSFFEDITRHENLLHFCKDIKRTKSDDCESEKGVPLEIQLNRMLISKASPKITLSKYIALTSDKHEKYPDVFEQEACLIFLQILKGLEYLLSKGIEIQSVDSNSIFLRNVYKGVLHQETSINIPGHDERIKKSSDTMRNSRCNDCPTVLVASLPGLAESAEADQLDALEEKLLYESGCVLFELFHSTQHVNLRENRKLRNYDQLPRLPIRTNEHQALQIVADYLLCSKPGHHTLRQTIQFLEVVAFCPNEVYNIPEQQLDVLVSKWRNRRCVDIVTSILKRVSLVALASSLASGGKDNMGLTRDVILECQFLAGVSLEDIVNVYRILEGR